ncbi:excinuclease ABC subunit UvrC [Pseudochelatococcus contaminans]|uniref:UvrABC system protein C n=1 Tax=Pseudochelatococcus contaminans TaxID=1538103 RepID=A0A7W6EFN5_9HYPH|nr:excinuclease ABC subunit UvrC [Pseudochelatococcus contaminans]MBB3808938.1 excinuclease ABC subunit C [Pseudochelatococcus contaminans]
MIHKDDTPTNAAAATLAADDDLTIETDLWAEDASAPPSLRAGAEVIRRFWKTLPHAPGVYRMIDANGHVLYVGKALDLKKRVASYVRGIGHGGLRTMRMIAETVAMEFITTDTETAALLLEANLIKQLRPRYNVLMRDDKSFPYILLTGDHAAPQLVKHRGARVRKGRYFGPFADGGAVNRTVNALQRAFLLRTCTDSYYENRTRPCLLFQIKRCAGPCTGEISQEDYAKLVDEAGDFLTGRSIAVKRRLAHEMQEAAEALEYERAARYRDRLAALSAVQGTQNINPQTVEEADVFAIASEAGMFCVQVFFFRNSQNWGNRSYFPRADRNLPEEEVLSAFLAQFYEDKPCPRLVLLSHKPTECALLQEALSDHAGHRVEVAVPKRGEKYTLVAHAHRNAQEALARKLADTASQDKLLGAVAQAFGLERPPRRIEVYDNSHIMGTNAVGAMIVAGREGFMKPHYRTFNIRSTDITPGDDFGMMREVLQRRFTRLVKEGARLIEAAPVDPEFAGDDEVADEGAFPSWPDLLLIDGGQGQVGAVRATLKELGVSDVPVVGVAKGVDRDAGRETFFVEGRAPFRLPPRDATLYYVERLRDEAHRFAIGTHRARRKREFTKSPLDEIAGIGPARKRALLLHFGTAKAVSQASLEDLRSAPGINAATAGMVYRFFHDRDG